MDLFGVQAKFFYSPRAHEGHEEWTIGLEATEFQNDFLFLRALRVLRGGVTPLPMPDLR
jgi:hypothetical protein